MNDALDRIGAARVVPVLTVADADKAEKACRALVAGGLPVVEITFRTDAAAEAIRRAAAIDGLLVGAGSILSPEQLGVALEAGAQSRSRPERARRWSRRPGAPARTSSCLRRRAPREARDTT